MSPNNGAHAKAVRAHAPSLNDTRGALTLPSMPPSSSSTFQVPDRSQHSTGRVWIALNAVAVAMQSRSRQGAFVAIVPATNVLPLPPITRSREAVLLLAELLRQRPPRIVSCHGAPVTSACERAAARAVQTNWLVEHHPKSGGNNGPRCAAADQMLLRVAAAATMKAESAQRTHSPGVGQEA
eukprot:scaffold207224_cov31-Tisochrysis_lutea.AAC.1